MSARQIGQPVAISTSLSTQAEQKRAWPHGTSAIPVRRPMRHSSHESTAGSGAGDVELCAAGDDVVACWLSSTSASLLDASSLLSHEMHSKRTVDNGANPRELAMLAPHASLVTPSVVL